MLDVASHKIKVKNIRKNVLTMTHNAKSGHLAGPMSSADILFYLYYNIYEFNDLTNTTYPIILQRLLSTKFILSCAHYAPVYYAILAEIGVIDYSELLTLRQLGSRLQGHTHRNLELGMLTSGGSLGQGLGIACGIAHYEIYKSYKEKPVSKVDKVYCMISDGECNEGSIWESALFANKYNLDNLIVILDRNNVQQSGDTKTQMPLEPLADKWESFGWEVFKVNGNDIYDIDKVFRDVFASEKPQPKIIISYTIPGKGVSFIESDYHWHGKVLNDEQLEKALLELGT